MPEVTTDIEGKARQLLHPDIGPYAAPAQWWKEIDSGQVAIVDGTVPLDAAGRDAGLGTPDKPFATLAKAAAYARWGTKIFIKDASLVIRNEHKAVTFLLDQGNIRVTKYEPLEEDYTRKG